MATDSQERLVPGIGLPPGVVEDILSVPRRETMLRCLADADGSLVVDDLVACVRDREGDTSGQSHEQVRANLYDKHLPKLTATGVVTYDSMREALELTTPAITEW